MKIIVDAYGDGEEQYITTYHAETFSFLNDGKVLQISLLDGDLFFTDRFGSIKVEFTDDEKEANDAIKARGEQQRKLVEKFEDEQFAAAEMNALASKFSI